MARDDRDADRLRESVDLLILKSLACGSKDAPALMAWIQTATRTTVRVEEGTLYPALHRLTRTRLVRAHWSGETVQAVKVYELTPMGSRQLVAHSSTWRRHVDAIGGALALMVAEAAG